MVWKSITADEYRVLKSLIAVINDLEQERGISFHNHELEPMREVDEMRTMMQAAVEGYEAEHRSE